MCSRVSVRVEYLTASGSPSRAIEGRYDMLPRTTSARSGMGEEPSETPAMSRYSRRDDAGHSQSKDTKTGTHLTIRNSAPQQLPPTRGLNCDSVQRIGCRYRSWNESTTIRLPSTETNVRRWRPTISKTDLDEGVGLLGKHPAHIVAANRDRKSLRHGHQLDDVAVVISVIEAAAAIPIVELSILEAPGPGF